MQGSAEYKMRLNVAVAKYKIVAVGGVWLAAAKCDWIKIWWLRAADTSS